MAVIFIHQPTIFPVSLQTLSNQVILFEMVDTSTINLQMNLAIHEFNRSTIGFDDITIQNPLNGEDATVSDLLRDVENVGDGGAPADLIRHFFDENVNGALVKDLLVDSMNTTLVTY